MEGSKPNLAHVWGKNLISRPALFFLRGGFDPIQIGWGLWVESRLPFIPYVDPNNWGQPDILSHAYTA